MRALLVLSPLVLVAPLVAPLAAQEPAPTATPIARVDSGAVVRVTAPRAGLDRRRARAVASQGDSLTVMAEGRRRGDSATVSVA
ncbi:MAG: hypothetical protein ACXW0Z_02975 [Gemmatirosa sp.]